MSLFKKQSPRFTSAAYADVAVLTLGAKKYYHDSLQEFVNALNEAREKTSSDKIVVDLGKVQTLSSAAIGPMAAMHRTLQEVGGGIAVAGATGFTRELLSFANVPFETYDTVPDALKSERMAGEAATIYAQEN